MYIPRLARRRRIFGNIDLKIRIFRLFSVYFTSVHTFCRAQSDITRSWLAGARVIFRACPQPIPSCMMRVINTSTCIPYLRYFVDIQNTHICIHFKFCARMDVQPSLQDAACLEDHARACEPRRRDIALYANDNAPYTRSARESRWRGAALCWAAAGPPYAAPGDGARAIRCEPKHDCSWDNRRRPKPVSDLLGPPKNPKANDLKPDPQFVTFGTGPVVTSYLTK